jgi:hypothetical protein
VSKVVITLPEVGSNPLASDPFMRCVFDPTVVPVDFLGSCVGCQTALTYISWRVARTLLRKISGLEKAMTYVCKRVAIKVLQR